MTGKIAMMAGRMLLTQGDRPRGFSELQQAMRDPQVRQHAELIIGLDYAKQGECRRALPIFERLLLDKDSAFASEQPVEPFMAMMKCAVERNQLQLAEQAAGLAAEHADGETEKRYLSYLAQLYADEVAVSPEEGAEESDRWSVIAQEMANEEEFRKSLDDRKSR